MQADLIMVIGVVIACFAIPAFVSAWSEKEAPRAAALFVLIGFALGFYATTVKPGGFAWWIFRWPLSSWQVRY